MHLFKSKLYLVPASTQILHSSLKLHTKHYGIKLKIAYTLLSLNMFYYILVVKKHDVFCFPLFSLYWCQVDLRSFCSPHLAEEGLYHSQLHLDRAIALRMESRKLTLTCDIFVEAIW